MTTATTPHTLNDLVTEAHDLRHSHRMTRADYDRLVAAAREVALSFPLEERPDIVFSVARYAESRDWLPADTAL